MILPFLNIEIILFGDDTNPEKSVMARVLPDEISCYHPSYRENATIVYVGNGSIYVPKTVPEFEKILNTYWDKVRRMAKAPIVKTLGQA